MTATPGMFCPAIVTTYSGMARPRRLAQVRVGAVQARCGTSARFGPPWRVASTAMTARVAANAAGTAHRRASRSITAQVSRIGPTSHGWAAKPRTGARHSSSTTPASMACAIGVGIAPMRRPRRGHRPEAASAGEAPTPRRPARTTAKELVNPTSAVRMPARTGLLTCSINRTLARGVLFTELDYLGSGIMDDLARLTGKRLRAARRERGLSLGALAAAAHVGKGSLSEIENGVRNPTLGTLYALAGALGVPLATLLADRPGVRVVSPGIEARLLDVSRDAGRDGGRDTGRGGGRDTGRDGGRDAGRDGGRDGGQTVEVYR